MNSFSLNNNETISDDEDDDGIGYNEGRWSKEEQEHFVEGLVKYRNDWKRIQRNIRTRSSTQVRSHAQKFFLMCKKEMYNRNTKKESREQLNEIFGNAFCTLNYIPDEEFYVYMQKMIYSQKHRGMSKFLNLKDKRKKGLKTAKKESGKWKCKWCEMGFQRKLSSTTTSSTLNIQTCRNRCNYSTCKCSNLGKEISKEFEKQENTLIFHIQKIYRNVNCNNCNYNCVYSDNNNKHCQHEDTNNNCNVNYNPHSTTNNNNTSDVNNQNKLHVNNNNIHKAFPSSPTEHDNENKNDNSKHIKCNPFNLKFDINVNTFLNDTTSHLTTEGPFELQFDMNKNINEYCNVIDFLETIYPQDIIDN